MSVWCACFVCGSYTDTWEQMPSDIVLDFRTVSLPLEVRNNSPCFLHMIVLFL